ncbi:AAA family ATPase [Sulfurisphaera ohwakuensis]|uniref:AAA family ATPase n=1 Tax=Sulfurisphaera ohwakuensis TaxID=69656 RepID=A0A650CEV8_SULOH|nr:AAA family ATPase [Sulfurisphaera ohwakuensis]MBB5252862.1 SpoVK/Ycf46/Vps4 family AAA+-type ATPase [Sulfurisphaera ohwakuensis]QGR16205.1 AAA family ATPase [Sulfurisphaera ohwakuensis]
MGVTQFIPLIEVLGAVGITIILLVLLFRKQTQKFILSDKALQIQQKSQKKKEEVKEKITWDMIGGYDDVKKEIKEYIEIPLKYKEIAKKYGLRPPKGILLFGPPGCGKSLMMRALANEAKINFIYVNVSDIMSKWYGESEARLRELFANARKNAPCILFFDEIDTIGVKRESHTGDSVTPRLLSLMLSEIDGLQSEDGVIIVGSTNVPHLLDKALLRAGRFDKLIYIGVPDKKSRKEIFLIHCKNMPLGEDVDFDKLAEMTERFTGADIANVCQEVARMAAVEALEKGVERKITLQDFANVIKRYKPSVTLQMLDEYEKFRLDYERKFRGPELPESEDAEKITLNDIGGYEEIKKELYDLLEMQFKYYNLMEQMKIPSIRGILLYGPPGVGKTMMAKALARTLGVRLIMLSGAEILYKGYEGAVSAVKEVFNRARENKPSILLLDELDAIAPKRENQKSEASKIVNQLLTEMDGIRSLKEVVVIGTTNRLEDIDPALKRPGRFDRIIYMPLPNKDERKDIFEKYLGKDICEQVNCDKLADITEGYSGADIAAVTREAKLKVLKEIIRGNKERKLTYEDLLEAIAKVKPSVKKEQLNSTSSDLKKE